MKSIIKYMTVGLLLVSVTGCTDLNVDINSKYTEYPDDKVAIEAKMADVYYAFRGALGRRYNEAQTLSTDEAVGVSFDGDYVDANNYSHMSLHTFSPDDAAIGYWSDLSSGITKCNQVINDFGGSDADPATVAPARVMRAFYHFILMDSFGDVPVMDKLPEDGEAVERRPRADVAAFVEKEILESLPYLSEANDASTYGKPNKWMAEAMLVKLYINWAVYTAGDVTAYDASAANPKLNDCVKYCDDIISSGLFDLKDSYRSKFMPDNGVQIKDFIYAMPYDCITQTGMTYARFRTWRKADGGGADGQTTYYGEPKSNSWAGNFAMSEEFANLFNLASDDRLDAVLHDDYIPVFNPSTKERTTERWTYQGHDVPIYKTITLKEQSADLNVGADANGYSQGWKSIKFYPVNSDYQNGRNQSNDVPIFRYADILLTKAEAITRGAAETGGDTPQSLFNQIRAYVNAPQIDHDPSLDELLDERGREFFDENWRRNDLIRFGKFESEFGFHKHGFPTANFDKTRRIFPVPTSILNENTNWTQNDGY